MKCVLTSVHNFQNVTISVQLQNYYKQQLTTKVLMKHFKFLQHIFTTLMTFLVPNHVNHQWLIPKLNISCKTTQSLAVMPDTCTYVGASYQR